MYKNLSKFKRYILQDKFHSIIILILILALILLSQIYKKQIVGIGNELLIKYHKSSIYFVLFILAAISSTLVPLPVWIYEYTYVALGYNYLEGAIIIGLGASVGSFSSYIIGRYFRYTSLFRKKFGHINMQKWEEKSRIWIVFLLLFGIVSPVPMDVFYAISGIIRFPMLAFICYVSISRIFRYLLMGYIFYEVY